MMTCAAAPSRQLAIAIILLAMPALTWSVSMRGIRPAGEQVADTHSTKSTHFVGEQVADNVKVYQPHNSSQPVVGSLILLMGYGADLWWTMTQWWYLHPAWSASDQEWCKQDCVFGYGDKMAALALTNNLRIVDAVGKIKLAKHSHAWYKYTVWPDGPPIERELEDAVANVFELIEREYRIVGDYNRIAIAGMSQGADLALEVGIRFPHQLGMVVSQRGVLKPSRRQGINNTLAAGPGTPFILTAGDSDELTSLATYKGDCTFMQSMHTPVFFKYYAGLNHGDFSKPEWTVLVKAFSLMLSPHPRPKADQIAQLTTWNSCAPY